MKRRYPLHVHIAVLFVVLILVVGGLLAWIGFQNSRSILEQGAQALSERIGREAGRTFARVVDSAEDASRLLSRTALGRSSTHADPGRKKLEILRNLSGSRGGLTMSY